MFLSVVSVTLAICSVLCVIAVLLVDMLSVIVFGGLFEMFCFLSVLTILPQMYIIIYLVCFQYSLKLYAYIGSIYIYLFVRIYSKI